MKLYLDTSSPNIILRLDDKQYEHEFGNDLAEKLLAFMNEKLSENGRSWQDVSEITFMSGPGSFTGLRIGAAIINTLAQELQIPLKAHLGDSHPIIIPNYGRGANISQPKK